jgi:hypothetical protein
MVNGTQMQTTWAPGSGTLLRCWRNAWLRWELKLRHLEPLAHGRLLYVMMHWKKRWAAACLPAHWASTLHDCQGTTQSGLCLACPLGWCPASLPGHPCPLAHRLAKPPAHRQLGFLPQGYHPTGPPGHRLMAPWATACSLAHQHTDCHLTGLPVTLPTTCQWRAPAPPDTSSKPA